MILERTVLDQVQEPALGASLIESVHHIENAHAVYTSDRHAQAEFHECRMACQGLLMT